MSSQPKCRFKMHLHCNTVPHLLLYILLPFPFSSCVLISTKQGHIQGHQGTSRQNRQYFRFLGIPYGTIPERFAESEPALGWTGTFNASSYGNDCGVSEDCLNLNVFTPEISGPDKLPVLFWIHGGAFQFGSGSSFGPEYFMDEDVVVVTINYRLGILGFFNLDVDGAPGNQGLKDMILALKWTQENIGSFGGDRHSVTIFGESAGGAAVSYLILSPLSKGLFHRAISQSGTALCPWAFHPNVKATSLHTAETLGCAGGLELEVLECMRNLTWEELKETKSSGILPASFVSPMKFVPTIERRDPGPSSTIFLSKTPLEVAQDGGFMNVPYILGINKYEAGVGNAIFDWFSNETLRDLIPVLGPRTLGYMDRPDALNISRAIQRLYFHSSIHGSLSISSLIMDRTFLAPTRQTALLHAKKSRAYLYSFDKPGTSALVPFLTLNTPQHADELTYLWVLSKPPFWGSHVIMKESSSFDFSVSFVRTWAEFSRTGRPLWTNMSKRWRRYTRQSPIWFHIDDNVSAEIENRHFTRKMDFWHRL